MMRNLAAELAATSDVVSERERERVGPVWSFWGPSTGAGSQPSGGQQLHLRS